MRRVFSAAVMMLAASALGARPAVEDSQDLKGLYARSCAVCHGEDGSGRTANGQKLGGRDLANPRWQVRVRDSEMVNVILKGKGAMPAFGALISDAEALKLVTEVIRPMAAKKH